MEGVIGGGGGREAAVPDEAGVVHDDNQATLLLPEGWAEAVDASTGHVYFYSESR